MITLQERLRLSEEVAAKVIDGEAILINLASGVYYSMDGVGARIWELLGEGHDLEAIVMALSAAYDVSPERLQSDVKQLVAELCEEQLVVKSPDRPVPLTDQTPSAQKLLYESPVLNVYRDMEDLLALDPPTPGLEVSAWRQSDAPAS